MRPPPTFFILLIRMECSYITTYSPLPFQLLVALPHLYILNLVFGLKHIRK